MSNLQLSTMASMLRAASLSWPASPASAWVTTEARPGGVATVARPRLLLRPAPTTHPVFVYHRPKLPRIISRENAAVSIVAK